jgi:hypothetical protein
VYPSVSSPLYLPQSFCSPFFTFALYATFPSV